MGMSGAKGLQISNLVLPIDIFRWHFYVQLTEQVIPDVS
jgi:hypothetical protein